MFKSPSRVSLILVLALLVAGTAAIGQQVFGSIYGTVTDASGAAVPNAKITITDQNKGIKSEVTTNDSGNYTKGQLIPGTYTVEVENPGFSRTVSKDIVVNVDAAARVDLTMTVGNVSEQVEVTGSAPLLQSDRADVSITLTASQLTQLPSLNRNFQNYELLLPGTQKLGWQHASSENPQGSAQIQVNGQHFSGTGFQLDGTDNQDPILGIIIINPNLDSLVEAKIASQNYDAEFGYAGAGIGIASTKSGTNDIHGSAFEYLRNNSPGFQSFARDPFNSAESKQVPTVIFNQFGGSIGGAVVKNKLFYFGDAQLTRRRTGSSVKTSVPTLLARTGNFSEYLNVGGAGNNTIYDPTTGNQTTGVGRTAFTNNTIPMARLSQQALNILKFLPAPNAPGDPGQPFVNNFAASGSEAFDSNQWDARGDFFANEKSSLFGRYSDAGFTKFAPGAFGVLSGGPALDNINFAGTSVVHNRSLAIGYTRTINPTLVTDLRFGYVRYKVNVLPNGLGTSPAKDAGIPGLNLDNFFTSGLPAFFINGTGGTNLGYSLGTNQCNCPLDQKEQQYQIVSNTTKVSGNHSFKFGADLRYALNLRVPSDSHRAGELTFDPGYTGLIASQGAGVTQGLGLATFLLGEVTHFSRYVSPTVDASERQKRMFFYAQDTWRITPKLQLNYGLRWEMIFPEKVNAKGNGGQLDLRTGEIAVFGVGNVSDHGIQDMNYKNFAPRVGITYQLTPKTVIRTGYGWSYELGTFGTLFGHNVTQNLPILANQQVNRPNDFSGVFTLAQGPQTFSAFGTPDSNGRFKLPDGVGGKARPLNVVLPRVMAFNFTVQHQLFKDLSISAGYVGNQGRHVFAGDGPSFNANQASFIPGSSDENSRKPYFAKYGWTQGIDFYCNCANNRYDSLQFTVEKRYSAGFTLTSNYTFQKAQGDGGDSYTFLYNRPLGYQDNGSVSRHQLTVAPNFDIPFGHGRRFGSSVNRAVDAALGGWNLSGVTVFYSGRPFTPNIGNAGSHIRPNEGPGGLPDKGSKDPFSGAKGNRDQFFLPGIGPGTAFMFPADNTFGNYGQNTLHGPIFINQDLALGKSFRVTERAKMLLRAEAYNAFNHTNLGDPNNDVTNLTNGGQINGIQGQMRRLQFALRLDF